MRTAAAIVPVVVMDSIEVVDGPIDDLVRYSRVCCVVLVPKVGPPTLLILIFRQIGVDSNVLREVIANSSLLRRDELS